jgi:dTMP kinase
VTFIVMEGGEGVGKTTQSGLLVAKLRGAGHEVDQTREPGGTPEGVLLRQRLLHDRRGVTPEEELDLMLQDRRLHIEQRIGPELARGMVVVCDRFSPSTIAYQGVARGMGVEYVEGRCHEATAGTEPDVVVVLDLADEVAESRVAGFRDRFEREGAEFHAAVRNAYRELAVSHGWVIVDASGSAEAVAARVWAVVEPYT